MQEKMLPQFQGKPLVEISDSIPQADFLEGEFGNELVNFFGAKDYRSRMVIKGGRSWVVSPGLLDMPYNPLHDLTRVYGKFKGTNPFAVVLANQILREEGLRTVTPADVVRILKKGTLELGGSIIDTALIVDDTKKYPSPICNKNVYLSENLISQIRERSPNQEFPVAIPLAQLELVEDEKAEKGLAFILRDDSQILPLTQETRGDCYLPEDLNESTGLPDKTYLYPDQGVKEGVPRLSRKDYNSGRQSNFTSFCFGVSRFGWNLSYLGYIEHDLSKTPKEGRIIIVNPGK